MRTELPDNDTLQGSSQPKILSGSGCCVLQRLQQNDRELLERHLLEGHSLKRLANDDAMTCRQLGRRIKHLVEELKQWAHQDGLLTLKQLTATKIANAARVVCKALTSSLLSQATGLRQGTQQTREQGCHQTDQHHHTSNGEVWEQLQPKQHQRHQHAAGGTGKRSSRLMALRSQ